MSSHGFSFGIVGKGGGPDRQQLLRSALQALGSGNEQEALARLDALPLKTWRDPRLWQAKALLHRELGELEGAIAAFDEAATLTRNDPTILHGRARARMEAGMPALAAYREALTIAPGDNDLLLGMIALVGDRGDTGALLGWFPRLGLVLVIWLLTGPAWEAGRLALTGERGADGTPARIP